MKAFFTDDQLLHDPQQFMRLGRIATDRVALMRCARALVRPSAR